MDDKLGGAERRIGLSVDRLVGQLKQLENARVVEDELVQTRSAAHHLRAENQDLEERLAHAESCAIALQAGNNRLQAVLRAGAGAVGKTGVVGSPQKENVPPATTTMATATVAPTQSVVPRLTFRGLSSWFGAPQSAVGSNGVAVATPGLA